MAIYTPWCCPSSHGDRGTQRGQPAHLAHLSPAHEAELGKQVLCSGAKPRNWEQCRLPRPAVLPRSTMFPNNSNQVLRINPPELITVITWVILVLSPTKERKKVKLLCRNWLCDPIDWSLLGSSVHGIFQARVLEWVTIYFSRGSSRSRDRTQVSHIAGRCFTI